MTRSAARSRLANARARMSSRPTRMPGGLLQGQVLRGFVGNMGDAKYIDVAGANYGNNTTGSVTLLNVVPQGDTVNTRDGKAFRCTSINIRGKISVDSAAVVPAYANYLVWDYQPNKALAALTDILESATSTAFPKRENNRRFKIIKKYYGALAGNSTAPATGLEVIPVDDYVILPPDCNTVLTAADTTGVIADMIQGALLWVSVGDAGAGTGDINSTIAFRLNFTEKLT